jgi:UDP-N-acetylmuramoylalanine--D-glutamate ligase
MKVLVWGGGREGAEAARVLTEQKCSIAFVTDTPESDIDTATLANEFQTTVISPADIAPWNPDFIVRSPGVSRYRTELSGFPSSGLFALWLADQDLRRVIGVTGTKGKSTTSTLIAQILTAAGHTVELAGNIGVPVTRTSPQADFVVVEVSSYQASDCTVSPFIGVLTSLDIDHLPWHGSVEKYHQDKLNLFAHPEIQHMIFHAGHPMIDSFLQLLTVDQKRFSNSQHSVHVALATPQGEEAIRRMGNTTFPKNLGTRIDSA